MRALKAVAEIFAAVGKHRRISAVISAGTRFHLGFSPAVPGSQLSRGGTLAGTNGSCDEKRKIKNQCGWSRGHIEVGQQFSRTNILVLAPGNKHNTAQDKCRNEVKMWARTVAGDQDHPRPSKPSNPFPGRPGRTDCA